MDRSVFDSSEEYADELFNHLEELLREKDPWRRRAADSRTRELLAKFSNVNAQCAGSRKSLRL